MTTALAVVESTQISAAHTDDMLIALFVQTKRSDKTKVQYAHSIRMLCIFTGKPLNAITLQDAVNYHEWLRTQYSSLHSIKAHVNIAKALCSFGVELNYLRTNVFAPVKTDVAPEVTHKRILTEEQVLKLIDAPKRQRDKLLLRLVYAAGLRVSEVCGLVWSDLLSNGVLHIRMGKGQKERFITLSDGMIQRMNDHRGNAADNAPMFPSQMNVKKDGIPTKNGQHLAPSMVHRIVKSAAAAAGLPGDASAHWLRHSHASHSLDRGATLVTVRDTLGHSSIATTNKYLHSKRQDSSALHLAV